MHTVSVFHFLNNDLFYTFFFVDGYAEVQFIVYLQYHFSLYAFCLESLINACHCYLYDICGTSLNRCVDGVSLGIAAYNGVS